MAFVTPRSVGLMLAATAVAGWFEAGALLQPAPRPATAQQMSRPQSSRNSTPRSTRTVVPDAARLRDWRHSPPTPARGRNPFVFGSRAAGRETPAREFEEAAVAPPPVAVAPPMPIFKLSGIASNTEGDVVTLTAIIIDSGAMVFAKKGDKLSNGYSVVEVGEMSVTLVDAAGVTQTIRLP